MKVHNILPICPQDFDNQKDTFQVNIDWKKLEKAKSELPKFRAAIELCERIPQDFNCNEDTSLIKTHGTWLNE